MKNTIKGDITNLKVEAVVTAANAELIGGGGVDGAIHNAAGPELLAECKGLGGCPTGEARLTKGYNLLSKYVIHTVGPIWNGGNDNEIELLKACYWNSLLLALKHNIKSLAFPNISTGVYGMPKVEAAHVAIETITKFLNEVDSTMDITFVCYDDLNYKIYQELCPKFSIT